MKSIKFLQNQRWFIWAIVAIVVILGALAAYVYYVGQAYDWGVSGAIVKRQTTTTAKLVLPVTQYEAIALVTSLPDVQSFIATIRARHSAYEIGTDPNQLQGADTANPYWSVHVWEDIGNHTATFNWYNVYQKTGKVEAEF